jgi:hypothetical protein
MSHQPMTLTMPQGTYLFHHDVELNSVSAWIPPMRVKSKLKLSLFLGHGVGGTEGSSAHSATPSTES